MPMMTYCINASGVRCYYPLQPHPNTTKKGQTQPAKAAATTDPPAASFAADVAVNAESSSPDPLSAAGASSPDPLSAAGASVGSSGDYILTPGVTLDITMRDHSVFIGELISLGTFVPVKLKQDSGSYVAGQVVRLNSKYLIAIA